MAGMIKSSIHHFDGFVGLAGNGGGSGKDGRGAAICGASLVRTGIDTVETTFGVVSTISGGCCGGTGGAGGGLSPGSDLNGSRANRFKLRPVACLELSDIAAVRFFLTIYRAKRSASNLLSDRVCRSA